MDIAISMQGITKRFGNVVANKDVNLDVAWGEVHGLVGENGAGKTTLMKILYGMYHPDEGTITIGGKAVKFSSPKDAIAHGIGMVHQHFSLVPTMTVAENIVMGRPPKKGGFIDLKKSVSIVEELSEQYGLAIPPKAIVRDLPVGLQQRAEILKALYLGADILIMDEPTAVLTPQEIDQLMDTLRRLKEKGKSIVLITHKLGEVKAVTDRITVMRAGIVTACVDTKDTNEKEIARMMVGREILLELDKKACEPGDCVLDVVNLRCLDKQGNEAVRGVSLKVHRGEIVGIAGVQGNGQSELADAIAGLIPITGGEVFIKNQPLAGKNLPGVCRSFGVGHIHDDRMHVGSALNASIRDNFMMHLTDRPEFGKGAFIDYKAASRIANEQVEKYKIKIGQISDDVYSLSGGNMQKVIIAREMYDEPHLLIASQPTRGVDIGATEFIYQKLVEHRDSGHGVLLLSNELSEIMALSDRILVIYKGQILGELSGGDATEEEIGFLMAGITPDRQEEGGAGA